MSASVRKMREEIEDLKAKMHLKDRLTITYQEYISFQDKSMLFWQDRHCSGESIGSRATVADSRSKEQAASDRPTEKFTSIRLHTSREQLRRRAAGATPDARQHDRLLVFQYLCRPRQSQDRAHLLRVPALRRRAAGARRGGEARRRPREAAVRASSVRHTSASLTRDFKNVSRVHSCASNAAGGRRATRRLSPRPPARGRSGPPPPPPTSCPPPSRTRSCVWFRRIYI